MVRTLKYQLRLTSRDDFAEVARNHADDPSIAGPLTKLLCRRSAALKCQYDAFADYVKEAGWTHTALCLDQKDRG